MKDEKLIYMANQIAQGFGALPQAQAEQAVATHINQFWEPRMRAQLLALLSQGQAVGRAEGQAEGRAELSPLVQAAGPHIRRPDAALS